MPKKTEKVILCCLSFFASRPGAATSHDAFSGTVSVLNGIVQVDMRQKCVALCIYTNFVCIVSQFERSVCSGSACHDGG